MRKNDKVKTFGFWHPWAIRFKVQETNSVGVRIASAATRKSRLVSQPQHVCV
jgi:hypothetical protein